MRAGLLAAFGASQSIAMASDFVIASETARFGAAFGKIGLTWSLPQRIGSSLARDLMFTGRAVKVAEAKEIEWSTRWSHLAGR